MSRRNVNVIILCEDTQHEAFIRRFLAKTGWDKRRVRVDRSPGASAEQYVRLRFPQELDAYRRKRHQVGQAVIVMLDGDAKGVAGRLEQLDEACQEHDVETRQPEDRVAIFVPTWNIETWMAYLDGEDVDESRSDYPRLARQRDCSRHVNSLVDMCNSGKLRDPAPSAFSAACEEYSKRLLQSQA